MASVSMKAVKSRIKSVEGTMQITHAMELVSASKLRRAKERALVTKPVKDILTQTLSAMRADREASLSDFFKERKIKKTCYIVIAGDRGLAGGYNSNLFKTVSADVRDVPYTLIPIGKKSLEHFKHNGREILSSNYQLASEMSVSDCLEIGKLVSDGYAKAKFDRVVLAYTRFDSVLTQTPVLEQILPFSADEKVELSRQSTIYEPSSDDLLCRVSSQYIATFLYCAIAEAQASEHAARRNSMSSANKNGETMLADMRLQYNRARQSVITQEITEIVAGAGHAD